jgi:hypothetical protein
MFLSKSQIEESLKSLESVHPFYGITFLVFKAAKLPVGKAVEFPINHEEERFLKQYYKPDERSAWYYRVFRVSDKSKHWLRPDYPWKGGQSVRTRTFGNAFIHDKNTDLWGWKVDYIQTLKSHLYSGKPIPAFHLAVWVYREREWSPQTTANDIIETFVDEFSISEEEKRELFDVSVPDSLDRDLLFQDEKVSWEELRLSINPPLPDDVPREEGGTLSLLKLEGVGPVKKLRFEPAERVSLITGDNGLGKTFILECAWWALTGTWTSTPAYPRPDAKEKEPKIIFEISGESGRPEEVKSLYDWGSQDWRLQEGRPPIPGLLIYARVDGAFAVWDPAKAYWASMPRMGSVSQDPLVFTREDVWNGLRVEVGGKTSVLSNGLIYDWINWQNSPEIYPFEALRKVLRRLSPPGLDRGDLGPLEPGDPVRVPGDARQIPTIKHSYGQIPLVHASAGVRRIVAMAYLIVWAWEEHKEQSQLIRKEPQRRMVILVDELEAHLHPQWQRLILPALLDVREDLEAHLQVQFLITTQSPLVMASMEPRFDEKRDKIFHLDLVRSGLFGREVILEEPGFTLYGPVDAWLRSDVFEMRHARSLEAEQALEDAKKLQMQDEVTAEEVREVSDRLVKYLAGDDEFWPRWTFFAEQHGVEL